MKILRSQIDYSTIYHIMLEYSITLHVWNEDYFDIPKVKERTRIYGESSGVFIL